MFLHKNSFSLKQELLRDMSILLGGMLIILIGVLSYLFYSTDLSYTHALLRERNLAIKYYIENYFTKMYNTVEFLSKNRWVRNGLYLDEKGKRKVLELYKIFSDIDPDINFIYSGYKDGSLLINNYTPPEGYDATKRPWYKGAIKAYPRISEGIPYQEIKTKKWLVSIGKALVDDRGKIVGVVAIDTSLNKILQFMNEKNSIYKSMNSFIIRSNNEIIIHKKEKMLKQVLGPTFQFTKDSGYLTYILGQRKRLGYYSKIKKLGWIVLTEVDKNEIIISILLKLIAIVVLVSAVTLLLGWFLSNLLGRRIITPLVKLRERVKAIIHGGGEDGESYIYPENEIGMIAQDIQQFTENELYRKNLELAKLNEKLKELSVKDHLTQLFNRHKMQEELKKEWMRAQRYHRTFSLIMIDIDWFKKINDTYGHDVGDIVLKEVADRVKKSVRSVDIVSRWGGEEFLILCPEIGLDGATVIAYRIRQDIENHRFYVKRKKINITVSIGVVEYRGEKSIEKLLKKVDKKLYLAKSSGRNTVIV